MSWDEPCLMQYEFRYGVKERPAVARLGFPRPDAARPGDWICSFQIEGLKDDKIRKARSDDGLHALTIASMAIRASLDRLRTIRVDGMAYEIVFPRYLPFCLGLEFHRKLCKLVDAELKKKNRQIRRRWRRRELRERKASGDAI